MSGFSMPAPKQLKDITKLYLLQKNTTARIRTIWSEYHKDHSSCVADVVSGEGHAAMIYRAKQFPMFVLPVMKKPSGYMTLVSQFQDKHWILTWLEDFKKSPAMSSPYFVLSLYSELVHSKNIGLLRGEVFIDKISLQEGQRLMDLLKMFYTAEGKPLELLKSFNRNPAEFSFDELLKLCNSS